jgi:Ser/Thr protein kinase RdoA (MazF antagonist)
VPASLALRDAGPDEVAAVASAAGAALARVGTVTFPGAGFLAGRELAVRPVPSGSAGLLGWVRAALDRAGSAGTVPRGTVAAWWRLLVEAAPVVDDLPPARSLVHSDYNPKNLLVATDGGVRVTAVLDWEFAYSGNPLADVGNWLRRAEEWPPAYTSAFLAGYRAAGGELPPRWEIAARVLDAMAIADLLTRGPGHPYARLAARLVCRGVQRGQL